MRYDLFLNSKLVIPWDKSSLKLMNHSTILLSKRKYKILTILIFHTMFILQFTNCYLRVTIAPQGHGTVA